MGKQFLFWAALLFALNGSNQAFAQNPNGLMNMFSAMMGAAIVNNARIGWSKIPPQETECIEQELREQNTSIGGLIQNGIVPNDPRMEGIRFDCRIAAIPPSNVMPNAGPAAPAEAQVDISRLSEKPTFDCSHARSLTARTACFDQTGAAADWDLITAYWASYFVLPENEREAFDQGHQDWLRSLNQKCPKAHSPSQCVLAAYHKRAAAYRAQLTGDALSESRLTPEQHGQIQQSLIERGLLDGDADGEFGSITRKAIRQFKAQSGAAESDFLTAEQSAQLLKTKVPTTTAGTTTNIAPVPPPPPPPRVETARLKDARVFLEDTKKFINQQKSLTSISDIAKEAANLQLALNQFDEQAAVDSKRKLHDLLKPLSGFAEFEQQQQSERNREEARHLAEGRTLGKQNEFFIDTYLQGHLGDSATQPLLSLRGQIESALKATTIDELSKANEAVSSYVKNNQLEAAYADATKKFGKPDGPPTPAPKTLKDSLTEKSKFLVEGPVNEIILLYNASPTAPKVWKNVRGDVVFQNDSASVCFAQPNVELAVSRYVDHYLGDRGAKTIASTSTPCDLSNAGKTIDIMVFQRGTLLANREEYLLGLAKMLESDVFRRYETIADYAEKFQERQKLSLQIEADLDEGSRKGFGVIAVTETAVACVLPPAKAELSDGLKELVKRNTDLISPRLISEWQYVDTSSNDLAFLGLQRHQCGFVVGDEGAVRSIMLALRREKIKYVFAAVWWDEDEVARATFDAHDAIETAILKKNELDRAAAAKIALDIARIKNKENEKGEIERKFREANGTKARGLMNYIHDLVSAMADKRPVEDANLFPAYSKWLNERFGDQWQTFNVASEVADFGTVQWEQRPLDAIVVKTIVQQKNRILGKYDKQCYLFGYVDDEEFTMLRNPFALDCSDSGDLAKWKIGERFRSQWNAE